MRCRARGPGRVSASVQDQASIMRRLGWRKGSTRQSFRVRAAPHFGSARCSPPSMTRVIMADFSVRRAGETAASAPTWGFPKARNQATFFGGSISMSIHLGGRTAGRKKALATWSGRLNHNFHNEGIHERPKHGKACLYSVDRDASQRLEMRATTTRGTHVYAVNL